LSQATHAPAAPTLGAEVRAAAIYALTGSLALLLQTTVLHTLTGDRIIPDLALILCVFLGLHEHSVAGATGAFLLGYLLDSFSGSLVGLNAFAMTTVYTLVYLISRRLWMDNAVSSIAMVFLGTLVKGSPSVRPRSLSHDRARLARPCRCCWQRRSSLPRYADVRLHPPGAAGLGRRGDDVDHGEPAVVGDIPPPARILGRRGARPLGLALVRLWHLEVTEGDQLAPLREQRVRPKRVRDARHHPRPQGRSHRQRPSFDIALVPEDARRAEDGGAREPHHRSHEFTGAPRRRAPPVRRRHPQARHRGDSIVALETRQPSCRACRCRSDRGGHIPSTTWQRICSGIGEVSRRRCRSPGYRMGDLIRKAGAERYWEDYLRSVDGGQHRGRRGRPQLRVLSEVERPAIRWS
jgi:rod shape-determining protein MreD